jgi:Leucine-rich repeat (LRR) protein
MVGLTEQMIRGKTRLEKMEDVRNLNLWGQDLDDVSLLSRLTNVEILSLSVNAIGTLRDFRHCTRLQELYLRKNEVADVAELQYLMGLRELKVLWLSDNPCAEHPYYRQLAVRLLPNLEKLDSQEVGACWPMLSPMLAHAHAHAGPC